MTTAHTIRRIYLAGPEVFLPDAIPIGERKKALCLQYGFEGAFPLDNVVDLTARPPRETRRESPSADPRLRPAPPAMGRAAVVHWPLFSSTADSRGYACSALS